MVLALLSGDGNILFDNYPPHEKNGSSTGINAADFDVLSNRTTSWFEVNVKKESFNC